MESAISKTKNSSNSSELEFDNKYTENDTIENNILDATNSETESETDSSGVCPECNNPNTGRRWCSQCNSKRFQQEFTKWTSGNKYIDNFIQESQLNPQNSDQVLEWIPYNRLSNINYLAKGGFSTVYKATWLDGCINNWDYDKKQWKRYLNSDEGYSVVIKSLDNSSNINEEFLNEWKFHFNCLKKRAHSSSVPNFIPIFGFTQDPNNLDYMIVMQFANDGSLRNSLLKNNFDWYGKLYMLNKIIFGLNVLHESNLVHCDLHDGNILISGGSRISDLGLCMAPEVLRGKPFTPSSDIYSFAMIMWELFSGVPPFNDKAHDLHLSLSICIGERPEIIEGTPQCYIDLMKKCWDLDPLQRPTASEVNIIIENWKKNFYSIRNENEEEKVRKYLENIENEQLRKDIEEFWKAEQALKEKRNNNSNNSETSNSKPITKSHPQACYTSRLLDFTKKLDDILEDNKVESYDTGISQSIDALNLTEEDINEALKEAENSTHSDKES